MDAELSGSHFYKVCLKRFGFFWIYSGFKFLRKQVDGMEFRSLQFAKIGLRSRL